MSSFTLVTGASGFVGRELCKQLTASGHSIRRTSRTTQLTDVVQIGNIDGTTDWRHALENCDAVVHLAARVHVMEDTAADPLTAFREVNTLGTLHLAREAAAMGIRKFVFLSSIKVNGESGFFSNESPPSPEDPYAISKFEAERGLRSISNDTGMGVVILRPPLVYGPGVGANFLRLLKAIDKKVPLPLGSVKNRRSLIYLGNLVDAIKCTLTHNSALGKTYLLSDGEALSTPELIMSIATALECSPRLISTPTKLMRIAGHLLGKQKEIDRLLGSLVVDSSSIRDDLAWVPPFTVPEGLLLTARWFREQQ